MSPARPHGPGLAGFAGLADGDAGPDLPGAVATTSSSSSSRSTTPADSLLPVFRLYPPLTHSTAFGASDAPHAGQLAPAGAVASGEPFASGVVNSGATTGAGPADVIGSAGAASVTDFAAGRSAGTTSAAPHAHFAF